MVAGGEAPPAPFALLGRAHIERLGVSKAEFCRRTLLSEKTYERIGYGRIADRPRPETVMQVCVGLGLPLPDAEGLFNHLPLGLGGVRLAAGTAYPLNVFG